MSGIKLFQLSLHVERGLPGDLYFTHNGQIDSAIPSNLLGRIEIFGSGKGDGDDIPGLEPQRRRGAGGGSGFGIGGDGGRGFTPAQNQCSQGEDSTPVLGKFPRVHKLNNLVGGSVTIE